MKRIVLSIFCLFLLSTVVGAQDKATSKPKPGRYIQTEAKETMVTLCSSSPFGFALKIQLVSVDVLDSKKMRLNFIVSNLKDKQCRVIGKNLKNNPMFIVDENVTKYKPISQLKAGWHPYKKKGQYVLAPTERTKATILFPVIVDGARKFDLHIGHKAQPIKNIELVE